MRKNRIGLFPVFAFFLLSILAVGCAEGIHPELKAAEDAIAAAKAEGAPDLCPEEYANAELKLKQAQLLFEENSDQAGAAAAVEAEKKGKEALDCALLAKQPKQVDQIGLPDELAKYKESVFFAFNDNTINPVEAKKLDVVAGFLTKYQKDHHFWIMIESHADQPGTPEDNLRLTDYRAKVIKFYLVKRGVDPVRVLIHPMGETKANEDMIKTKMNPKDVKKIANKPDQKYRRADIFILAVNPEEGNP